MCVYSGNVMKALSGFWRALLNQNQASFPDLWTTTRYRGIHTDFIIQLHFAHLHGFEDRKKNVRCELTLGS